MSSESARLDPGAQCMLRYREGDESAFDRLVELYSGRVYALLTRFLGPVPQREDLVQEVFLRVVRARARYEPTARFSTWLYRITFNLCANERERDAGRVHRSLENAADSESDGTFSEFSWEDERVDPPARAIEREDTVEMVKRAIASLPERQRMALILAKYEGHSYVEIARTLETSEKAVKSMVHRARRNLRTALAPLFEEQIQ